MSLTVTELVARLKRTVELDASRLCVSGEIGSCKIATSGHIYFTLKDSHAQLQCVLYRSYAAASRVRLREGLQVELSGSATVWEGRGSLQFIVSHVREAGQGSLQQQFEALKRKLEAEGLFSSARKRPLPRFPQSVGLITSPSGAVIQDMRHRLEQRAPWMQAYLYPVQVQGKGAEIGLARALRRWAEAERNGLPKVDYIILARGGGSLEDLWCFNEEVLARAIADSPIPVVSAVGHESDFSIADFVADLRAPTPTAAIELSTPNAANLDAYFRQRAQQLRQSLKRALQNASLRLKAAEQGRLRQPLQLLAPYIQKLDTLEEDLQSISKQRLQNARQELALLQARLSPRRTHERITAAGEHLEATQKEMLSTLRKRLHAAEALLQTREAQIRAASPQNALERGFALVQGPDGKLARRAADLQLGDKLRIRLAEGSVQAGVLAHLPEEIEEDGK